MPMNPAHFGKLDERSTEKTGAVGEENFFSSPTAGFRDQFEGW